MVGINARKVFVKEILSSENLRIPPYQRPYRWNSENVIQLLEDINFSKEEERNEYLIGSVIIHNNGFADIVDGQQRLTTLLLIQKACNINKNNELYCCALKKLKFTESSFKKIQDNYNYIEEWLKERNKKNFWEYVCNHCQFVQIEVTNLSDAFQMFDSQNGRGKELEAYNLLKAYHIKAIDQTFYRNDCQKEITERKKLCDQRWERAASYNDVEKNIRIDLLNQIFNEQLYRSRLWSRRENAWKFSKKKISEFKGVPITKNVVKYPFLNLTALLQHSIESSMIVQFPKCSRFKAGDPENINPFVNVNQTIINGKIFFDYVETYVEIYKRLFLHLVSESALHDFSFFYYRYCLNYDPSLTDFSNGKCYEACGYGPNRTGDTYLREVYKSLCLVVFDKFGELALNGCYKILYRLVYLKRLEQNSIKFATTAEFPKELFFVLNKANKIADLSFFQILLSERLKNFEESDDMTKFVPYDYNGGRYSNKAAELKKKNEAIKNMILDGCNEYDK